MGWKAIHPTSALPVLYAWMKVIGPKTFIMFNNVEHTVAFGNSMRIYFFFVFELGITRKKQTKQNLSSAANVC